MRYSTRKAASGFILAILTLPGTALALDLWPFNDDGIDYAIEVEGIDNEEYQSELGERAEEAIDPDNPPETVDRLQALKGLMSERVRQSLISEGRYEARVRAYLREEKEPPVVLLRVNTGPLYTISTSRIEWRDGPPLDVPGLETSLPPAGEVANAKMINEKAETIKGLIATDRCLLSLSVNPIAVLDNSTQQVEVVYRVDHGPTANFGPVTIEGETAVDEDIVRKYITWKQGECYEESKVEGTQVAILQSQLFAAAQIDIGREPDANGQVPVTITVTDREQRTISAGVNYESDRGAGVRAGWEHRNLWGRANKFNANASVAEREYSVEGLYSIPFFYHDQQKLSLSGSIKQEDTDAYESQNINLLAAVDRKLMDYLTVGLGVGTRFSHITETGEPAEDFGLVYFPGFAEWDTRDNVLDPTEGWFIRGSIAPYQDITGQGVNFIKSQINAQTYLSMTELKFKPTLALRGATGQISGASTDDVPADLRFYAGGGGSVRGYGYQALGPRENGAPLGGTRWNEFSAELRLRFTDTIGGVVFLDAGNVYDQAVPNPVDKLYFSTGVGARYFSPIGPLRFDVGIPLEEIEGEDGYGIYVSIGQAF